MHEGVVKWMKLTRLEKDIITCICMELTNKVIAEKLHYSEKSIEYHVKNIAGKLNVKTKVGIVVKVYQDRLI